MKNQLKMRLKTFFFTTLAVFSLHPIGAFEPSINVSIPVVSTYIFRGVDVFQNKHLIDKTSYSSFNLAPAIQPSITFNFSEGWYFNIWSSFALVNRSDADVDELLQEGPGDTGTIAQAYGSFIASLLTDNPLPIGIITSTIQNTVDQNGLEAYLTGSANFPNFYKEPVGLHRVDEVDLTLGYSFSTKLGTMSGGIVTYLLPNTAEGVVGGDQFTEIFVGYSPSGLPNLSIYLYGEFNGDGYGGSTFTTISYKIPIVEGDAATFTFEPAIAYQTQNGLQGIKYISFPFNLSVGNFFVSLVGYYRFTIEFFDPDPYKNDLVSLIGLSSNTDGKIQDPSKLGNGFNIEGTIISDIYNDIYTQAGIPLTYTYTPLQDIPRIIFYFAIGYSFSF
ncbi:MAG: hypothetical protein NZ853_10690 [Leptospiraceae bacterium]|nr:hypothetical protein [Leptospiraceae bacterium]MDW7977080.1 hypothetical protein [Leptospiraceae bacterium]